MPISPLLRKLANSLVLTDAEQSAVRGVPVRITEIAADQDVAREGERLRRSCIVLKGVACSYKIGALAKRQILNLHIAGDLPDLQSLHLPVLDMSIAGITPCTMGFLDHRALDDLCAAFPRIAGALWRETLIDAVRFRERIATLGTRNAYSRLAHAFCEYFVRSDAVGLVVDNAVEFPLTQQELGDMLGLSTVHVNRSLQEMRSENLISLKGTRLQVLDWARLRQVAEFDPAYLNIKQAAMHLM